MRTSTLPRRCLASLLILGLTLSGCATVRTTGVPPGADRAPLAEGTGAVEVAVFADDDDRRAGVVGPRFVAGELEKREEGRWVPVFKTLQPVWSVVDLPPGKYRVTFPALLDGRGNAQAIKVRPQVFRVRAGEVTRVETVLDHFPTGLVVAGVAAAVVAAVLLDEWLGDKLPAPPLPPLPALDAIFHVTLTMGSIGGPPGCCAPGAPVYGPEVTSHFPEQDALVAAKRVRVLFALSEPLNAGEIDPDAVVVVAEEAGFVPGTVTYDAENWWLVWEPEGDLPRRDILHATLTPTAVEDRDGNELAEAVTFTFKTTR